MKKITSNNNPLIKKIKTLQRKSSQRKKSKSFVAEGDKEIEKALKNKYKIESLFISENSSLIGLALSLNFVCATLIAVRCRIEHQIVFLSH